MPDTANLAQEVTGLLDREVEPVLGLALSSCGAIDGLSAIDGVVRVGIRLSFPAVHYGTYLKKLVADRLATLAGVKSVEVQVRYETESVRTRSNDTNIANIKHIIAVASGKGGVGKSTTAANLALALAYEGASVGLLDADIYGPSQPRMLGRAGERPTTLNGKTLQPVVAHGLKMMSIGLLVDEEQPMVWRGPMATQALNQILFETEWGGLDYLIVDMPPGTGDVQLTLSQRVPLAGAVIVTTPQDIALLDARKGLAMFQKVNVPVLGIVENMSTHICSKCGHEEHVFGAGGGRRMADQYGVELLGELPLDIRIREQADGGQPTVAVEPESAIGRAYIQVALRVASRLARRAQMSAPKISIEAS